MTIHRNVLSVVIIACFIFIVGSSSFYGYWNAAPPERTCISCHEIEQSYNMWTISAHREIKCIECHGTALGNGIHSLTEKGRMVFKHFSEKTHDDISLTEEQIISMNHQTCRKCHQAEYSAWKSGGHSVNYAHIFLDEKQNSKEQLNFDCLRCHGMFYEKDILSLVEPISIKGPWHLLNPEKETHPVIPCSSCHQIHGPGTPQIAFDYRAADSVHKDGMSRDDSLPKHSGYSKAGLYLRNEKIFLNASHLPKPVMWDGDIRLKVSDDPLMRLCIQCHAPTAWQQAGSADDRTPKGVHEGISCLSCHSPHSNKTATSCLSCHPAISNCGLDVITMNTTHTLRDSPNNIHSVSCGDCHDGKRPLVR
jgi:hypothetical protein